MEWMEKIKQVLKRIMSKAKKCDCQETIAKLTGVNRALEFEKRVLTEEKEELINRIMPHLDIYQFKEMGVNFHEKRKMWKATILGVDGMIEEEKYRALHTYVKRTKQQTQEFSEIAAQYANKPSKDVTAQEAVERICRQVQKRVNFDYQKDVLEDAQKVSEIFMNPAAILHELNENTFSDDCDGYSMLLYHLIDSYLEVYKPQQRWRLRLAIVKFYGLEPVYHMNLVWVDDRSADWVFIESTIWPERRMDMMRNPVRFQNNYEVLTSFDTKTEYEHLYKE